MVLNKLRDAEVVGTQKLISGSTIFLLCCVLFDNGTPISPLSSFCFGADFIHFVFCTLIWFMPTSVAKSQYQPNRISREEEVIVDLHYQVL